MQQKNLLKAFASVRILLSFTRSVGSVVSSRACLSNPLLSLSAPPQSFLSFKRLSFISLKQRCCNVKSGTRFPLQECQQSLCLMLVWHHNLSATNFRHSHRVTARGHTCPYDGSSHEPERMRRGCDTPLLF